MKKLRIDVSEMWDNLSGDNMGVLFEAFTDESRVLTEKWNKGNAHVTVQEKQAVGKFLVDIGAIQLLVKEEKQKVEVHCIRTHQQQALLASRQDAEERAREEEKHSGQERVIAHAPISPPNGATDVLYEHERDSYSPGWSGGGEDVSDEDDDAGFSGGNATNDVSLNVVNQEKETKGIVIPPKRTSELNNAKDSNHNGDHAVSSRVSQPERDRMEIQSEDANDSGAAVSSGVNQLEHERTGETISTIESSQVQVENAGEMEAALTLHKCTICNSFFPTTWQLDLHVYKCELMLYYHCPLCEKFFKKSKIYLSAHLREAHGMGASEIIDRVANLTGLSREEHKKKILQEAIMSKQRTRKNKEQDQKDPDFVSCDETCKMQKGKKLSKAQKHKKGKRRKADNPSHHADKKAQSSGGILTRSSARKVQDSSSVSDSCANREEEDVGSGVSSDTSADSGKEQVKNDPPEPGLIGGGNECDSHQKEQNDSKMECSEVGDNDSTLKEHLGLEDANDNMSAIRQDSPDDPGDISQGNSPTQTEKKTESLDDDANSKQEQRQEQKSKGNICHLCGETFKTRQALLFHIKTGHLGQSYECSTCGQKFMNLTYFKTHVQQHGDPKGAPHKCDICDSSYKSKSSLLYHRTSVHVEKGCYTCEICHVVLSAKGTLKRHINSMHTKEVKYPCEQCDRVFYEKCLLTAHMTVHTGIREWKCDKCDQSFYRKRRLNDHKRRVHIPSDSYLCDLCGARYKTAANLRQHHQTAHTDTSFPCELCGKKFKRKTHLKSHMEVHLDLRPHKCHLCEKSFRKLNNLRVHMDWHNGVRAHKCSTCDMSFLTKGNLSKHMHKHQKTRTHSCEECDRAFPDLTALRGHLAKVHNIVMESKITKAPTCLRTSADGAKTAERPDSTRVIPAADALIHGVPSVPSGEDNALLAPGSQVPELSTSIGRQAGMDIAANNSRVEESIPAFNVAEEGQATEALMRMMLPSS